MKIEYHKTFLDDLSLLWKNAYLPPKRAKRSKSGRGIWEKSTFLYIAQNWLNRFFLISCIKLEGIKWYKMPMKLFFGKILIFPKNGKKGPKIGK